MAEPLASAPSGEPRVSDADLADDARYARALGDRLRRVRQQQGRSLHDVEEDSQGRLKASVVGAYERGERTVSITRLHALADFYRVPVAELLPFTGGAPTRGLHDVELVIDLVALDQQRDRQPILARYAAAIKAMRGDYNGQVLSVRASDLETLAAVLDETPDGLRDALAAEGVAR